MNNRPVWRVKVKGRSIVANELANPLLRLVLVPKNHPDISPFGRLLLPATLTTARTLAVVNRSSGGIESIENCQEKEDFYTIHFKIPFGKSPFGSVFRYISLTKISFLENVFHTISFSVGLPVIKNEEQQRWPCQSSHRITVSLDGDHHASASDPSGDYPHYPVQKGRDLRGGGSQGSQRHLARGCHPGSVSLNGG